jgi:hypothetical protein
MKFNPYTALLTTGALMLTTVVMSESGSGAALLKAGVVSVDRDVASFAAKTWGSLEGRTLVARQIAREPERTRLASIDKQPEAARLDD